MVSPFLTTLWCLAYTYSHPNWSYFKTIFMCFVLLYNGENIRIYSQRIGCYNYFFFQFVVAISSVDFVTINDDKLNSDISGKELILSALLWKQLPWKEYAKEEELVFSSLYDDVSRIVEDWLFPFLFLLIQSVYWILYRYIYSSRLEVD